MTAPPGGPPDKELQKLVKGLVSTVSKTQSAVEKLRGSFNTLRTTITPTVKSIASLGNKVAVANLQFKHFKKFGDKINELTTKDLKNFSKGLNVAPKGGPAPNIPNLPPPPNAPNNISKAKNAEERYFNRLNAQNDKQFQGLNRIFAGLGSNMTEMGGILQEVFSRGLKDPLAAFETSVLAMGEAFVDAVTRSDALEKRSLGLSRNIQSIYQENTKTLEKLSGDTIENLSVALEFYSLGVRENTENLQKVANRIRLTGGDYKLFAKSMASNMVAMRINSDQAGRLAMSLQESSIQNGMSMDDLVASVTGLSKDLEMFSTKGMGTDIAAALGEIQAKAGAASQENIQAFAKTMLNSQEGIAIASIAGVQDVLMDIGREGGATSENLEKVLAGVSRAYKQQVGMFDNAIIAGQALRGSIFEAMAPIDQLQDTIKTMDKQTKHREEIDRKFGDTIATINEELLNPIKEFVITHFDTIKELAKVAGQLIKWGMMIAGVALAFKSVGVVFKAFSSIISIFKGGGLIKGLFKPFTDTFKVGTRMFGSASKEAAKTGANAFTRVIAGLGPAFLGMGKFLAKGLLRAIPIVGTLLMIWDVLSLFLPFLQTSSKANEKTAEELERERQRRERLERQQVGTISTLDKTMVALINVTRNRDASLHASLQTIAQASQVTARNTVPKSDPIRRRPDVYGN